MQDWYEKHIARKVVNCCLPNKNELNYQKSGHVSCLMKHITTWRGRAVIDSFSTKGTKREMKSLPALKFSNNGNKLAKRKSRAPVKCYSLIKAIPTNFIAILQAHITKCHPKDLFVQKIAAKNLDSKAAGRIDLGVLYFGSSICTSWCNNSCILAAVAALASRGSCDRPTTTFAFPFNSQWLNVHGHTS